MYGFVTSAGGGAVGLGRGRPQGRARHRPATRSAGLRRTGSFVVEGDLNPNIEHPNRGKRSIGLDIATDRGREVLYELVAPVPTCSSRACCPGARERFQIDVEHIRARSTRT